MEETFKARSMKQSFDWKLVLIYLLLVLIGWLNIYASIHSSEPDGILAWTSRSGKQFVWILTAFGLAGLIVFVLPPRIWEGKSRAPGPGSSSGPSGSSRRKCQRSRPRSCWPSS